MDYIIPSYVMKIIEKLEKAGYEAFLVGGSLRDIVLNKEPSDYDLTTNAKPDEMIQIFHDYTTILTGKKFGTVTVVTKKGHIEITTYRIEDEYVEGRRPSKVYFTNDLKEDLSRRDFTMNAMAYNEKIGLVDPFNGRKDLSNKLIKTVGNPGERFEEDHLRILRAVRFASQLNFTIETKTYNACKNLSQSLEKISAERIRDELFKILLSRKPSYGIGLMKELSILDIILPELVSTIGFDQKNPHHNKDIYNHTLCVIDNTHPILEVRLAALFHDIGKPHTFSIDEEGIGHFYGHEKLGRKITKKILNRLHCSNELIKNTSNLVNEHMTHHSDMKTKGLKRLICRVGEDNIFNLLDLQKADKTCSKPNRNIEFLYEREKQVQNILESKEAYEKKQLDISGYDIINLGFKEGQIIGRILDDLMERVLDNPELNEKAKLIDMVKSLYWKDMHQN